VARKPRPDPIIAEIWAERLRRIMEKLARARRLVDEIMAELEDAVQGAFDEGVLVGTMMEATGLSGSRIFQLKFAKRDRAKAAKGA
jgi:hypothetical protein